MPLRGGSGVFVFIGVGWEPEGGRGAPGLQLAPALAELGGSRINQNDDFARYCLLFLTMGLGFVIFTFRGPIYKVGVSRRREATFFKTECFA